MKYFDNLEFLGASVVLGHRPIEDKVVGHYSIKFVVDGTLEFGPDSERAVQLAAPCLFWQYPNRSYYYGPKRPGWEVHFAHFRGSKAEAIFRDGLDDLSSQGCLPVTNRNSVRAIFQQLSALYHSSNDDRNASALLLVERLLLVLSRDQGSICTPHSGKIEALCQRIVDQPGQAIDFQSEARSLALSYSHFRRLFKKQAGIAPTDFLINTRIEAMTRELIAGTRCIKEIAIGLGYDDVAFFSRLFRKRKGLSPRQYRAEYRV